MVCCGAGVVVIGFWIFGCVCSERMAGLVWLVWKGILLEFSTVYLYTFYMKWVNLRLNFFASSPSSSSSSSSPSSSSTHVFLPGGLVCKRMSTICLPIHDLAVFVLFIKFVG